MRFLYLKSSITSNSFLRLLALPLQRIKDKQSCGLFLRYTHAAMKSVHCKHLSFPLEFRHSSDFVVVDIQDLHNFGLKDVAQMTKLCHVLSDVFRTGNFRLQNLFAVSKIEHHSPRKFLPWFVSLPAHLFAAQQRDPFLLRNFHRQQPNLHLFIFWILQTQRKKHTQEQLTNDCTSDKFFVPKRIAFKPSNSSPSLHPPRLLFCFFAFLEEKNPRRLCFFVPHNLLDNDTTFSQARKFGATKSQHENGCDTAANCGCNDPPTEEAQELLEHILPVCFEQKFGLGWEPSYLALDSCAANVHQAGCGPNLFHKQRSDHIAGTNEILFLRSERRSTDASTRPSCKKDWWEQQRTAISRFLHPSFPMGLSDGPRRWIISRANTASRIGAGKNLCECFDHIKKSDFSIPITIDLEKTVE